MKFICTLTKAHSRNRGFSLLPACIIVGKKPFKKTPIAFCWLWFFITLNDSEKTMF